jgi:UDP-N-acetylmuramyl tripeptide synthase
MAWKVNCSECGTKESFGDVKDITYAKWRVIAWALPDNEPVVLCPECEYGKPNKK